MSNSQYKLDTNVSNVYKDNQDNTDEIQEEPRETNPNVRTGENYKLIYPSENSLFVFSISPILIDYGTISPNNPVKRTNTLSILSKHQNGYTVTVVQDHSLQTGSKADIPDTSCDTGTCTVNQASLWNNSLTYGFGYRCDNLYYTPSCLNDFSNANYYKSFINISDTRTPNPQPVIKQTKPINSKAQITYQLNVSRTQEEGAYNNSIIFVAIPNF